MKKKNHEYADAHQFPDMMYLFPTFLNNVSSVLVFIRTCCLVIMWTAFVQFVCPTKRSLFCSWCAGRLEPPTNIIDRCYEYSFNIKLYSNYFRQ